MLKLAEQAQAAGDRATALEAWQWVDREWSWISRSPAVRRWLLEFAEEAGVAPAEAAVDQVQAAVREELLPVLHLKWFLIAAERGESTEERALHLTFLASWRASPAIPPATARLYAAYLRRTKDVGTSPSGIEAQNVITLAQRQDLPPELRWELKDALSVRLATWLTDWVRSTPPSEQVRTQLQPIKSLEAVGPPTWRTLELLSLGHVVHSSRLFSTSTENALALDAFKTAISVNPYSPDAAALVQALTKQEQELRQALLRQALSGPGNGVSDAALRVHSQLREGLASLDRFANFTLCNGFC